MMRDRSGQASVVYILFFALLIFCVICALAVWCGW